MDHDCEPFMAALSAQADGEDLVMDAAQLESHLSSCGACQQYEASVDKLLGRSRVTAAPQMPDLARSVVKKQGAAERLASIGIVRGLLALVAVQVIILAIPDLLTADTAAGPAHAARHLGAFSLAYAAGLLLVVIRPARARTMLHVAAVLAGAMVLIAVVDVAQGRVPLLGESTHLPEILSVWFLWLLARTKPEAVLSDAEPSDAEPSDTEPSDTELSDATGQEATSESPRLRVVGPGESGQAGD